MQVQVIYVELSDKKLWKVGGILLQLNSKEDCIHIIRMRVYSFFEPTN